MAISKRPMKNGYHMTLDGKYFLHRVVYEKAYGKIPYGYEVHHIDLDKLNNSPDNLIAVPQTIHFKIHKVISNPKSLTKILIQALIQEEIDNQKSYIIKNIVNKKVKSRIRKK